MKILVLNGRPRVNGGTAAMTAAFAEGAQLAGHEVTELAIARMNLNGCKACEYCHTKGSGTCIQ